MERVLAVEVLHLLRAPGAYSVSVSDTLAASEVWQAYKHQKHDLFLPSGGDRSVSCQLHSQVHYLNAQAPCTVQLSTHTALCIETLSLSYVYACLLPGWGCRAAEGHSGGSLCPPCP